MWKNTYRWISLVLGSFFSLPFMVWAQEQATAAVAPPEPVLNSGDTAWMLISCALVLLMTPGLALFYGGMVRSKNVLSTMMHSFFAMGLVTLQWVIIGYSLSFGPDTGFGFIGGLDYAFLHGVDLKPNGTIPHVVFMMFQAMFAIITPALISGAFAERVKFSTYCVFTVLWATLVYNPICHWVWQSDGWLFKMGALDFAGGTVVHMSSGYAALVFALMLGKRIGYGKTPMHPNNLVFTALGAGLLWFGWYGFNAGSALSAGAIAGLAFTTTHISAAAAMVSWAIAEWIHRGKPSTLGAVSGLVAGLVVITPAAGFVSPMGSLIMGLLGGVVCYAAVMCKSKAGLDDALDAFSVHGVGGTLGAILTGVFAVSAFGGKVGLLEGNPAVMKAQLISVVATIVYSVVVTFILLKILDKTMGLRVNEEDEIEGLDLRLHGESAYNK